MLSANAIVELHDQLTHSWHDNPQPPGSVSQDGTSDWQARVARQHRANFDLWHIEDQARIPGCSDTALAETKRRVDSNQLDV